MNTDLGRSLEMLRILWEEVLGYLRKLITARAIGRKLSWDMRSDRRLLLENIIRILAVLLLGLLGCQEKLHLLLFSNFSLLIVKLGFFEDLVNVMGLKQLLPQQVLLHFCPYGSSISTELGNDGDAFVWRFGFLLFKVLVHLLLQEQMRFGIGGRRRPLLMGNLHWDLEGEYSQELLAFLQAHITIEGLRDLLTASKPQANSMCSILVGETDSVLQPHEGNEELFLFLRVNTVASINNLSFQHIVIIV
mmetsp:Transcript_41157/g.62574  ORF Transcript_41157/g.62574 Transcript_41157/m.62574 type:complete len:248 (-) Transcript_41157:538-1281(-)